MTLLLFLRVVCSSLVASLCLCAYGDSTVTWKPHPKAVSYVYVIAKDEAFSSPLFEGETDNPQSRDLEDLSPGIYFIKVRFIDRWGRASRFSPAKSFEVLKEPKTMEPIPDPKQRGSLDLWAEIAFIPNLSVNYDGKDFSKSTFLNNSLTKLFRSSDFNFAGTIGGIVAPTDNSKILYTSLDIQRAKTGAGIDFGMRSTFQYFNLSETSANESFEISGSVFNIGPTIDFKAGSFFLVDSHIGIDKDFSKLISLKVSSRKIDFNFFTLSPGIGYNRIEAKGASGKVEISSLSFLITVQGGE